MQTIARELKVRPKSSEDDDHTKLNQAIRFLGKNDQVKIFVMFRGREVIHPEAGVTLPLRFAGDWRATEKPGCLRLWMAGK